MSYSFLLKPFPFPSIDSLRLYLGTSIQCDFDVIQVANLTQSERDIKLFVVNDTGKRILKKKVFPQSSDRFFQKSLKKFT